MLDLSVCQVSKAMSSLGGVLTAHLHVWHHLLLVLGLQNLSTLLAQLGAVAVQGKCPALLGVAHVQVGSGQASLTQILLLSCL